MTAPWSSSTMRYAGQLCVTVHDAWTRLPLGKFSRQGAKYAPQSPTANEIGIGRIHRSASKSITSATPGTMAKRSAVESRTLDRGRAAAGSLDMFAVRLLPLGTVLGKFL